MEPIGNIPELQKIVKRVRRFKVTPAKAKLVEAAQNIREEVPTDQDKAYLSRFFVQCTLPHSNPGSVPIWTRRNGNLLLSIRPGVGRDGKVLGYPYGSVPRMLLFWMTTEAKRTHQRRLNLGDNLTQFMREVGMNPGNGTGKRSDAKRLREQMQRLFRAVVSLNAVVLDGVFKGHGWSDMQVAPKGVLWWDDKQPDQAALWSSWIELGEDFYNASVTSTVPYDLRALRALKKSPLALDMYALVNYHGGTLQKRHFISWTMLMQQMGGGYEDVDNFRRKATAALLKVRAVLPGVKVEKIKGGVCIYPGQPSIARTTKPNPRIRNTAPPRIPGH